MAASSVPVIDLTTEPVITCWGCLENQPNQMAHMDYGGCLYLGSDLDDDDASTIVDIQDGVSRISINPHESWQEIQDLLDTPPVVSFLDNQANPQDGTDEENYIPPPALHIPDIESDTETEDDPEDFIYNREMIINIFHPDSHPEFVSDILEYYEEGEYINNQELYDLMSYYNLAIPGFEDHLDLDPEIVEPLN